MGWLASGGSTPEPGGLELVTVEAAHGSPVICATSPLLQARPPSGPPAACV